MLLFFILLILLKTIFTGHPRLVTQENLHFDQPYTPQRALKATMLRPGVNRMWSQRFRKLKQDCFALGVLAQPRHRSKTKTGSLKKKMKNKIPQNVPTTGGKNHGSKKQLLD